MTTLSSREFNQDRSGAKKAAANGPVLITDRGKPSLVLLTFDEYQRLNGKSPSMAELLAIPDGDDIEFDPPRSRDLGRAADFS